MAQRTKKEERAINAFEAGEYHAAIDLYKEAYEFVNDREEKNEIIFRIANCYRIVNEPKQAELWYKKVIRRDFNNPEAVLYYADAMKMNEKYEDAIIEYRRYKELVPDDPRGEEGVMSCELAMQWMENPSGYQVEEMKFLNSRESDYAPAYGREDFMEVYFTSSRDESTGNDVHGATGQNFTDIYLSKLDRKGRWSTPVPLGEEINSEFEDGTPAFSKDFNTIYFTRCKVSKNKNFGCQIMTSTREGETWGETSPLAVGGDSIVIAHPAISKDDLILYFVSDMPGGMGGKDIYMMSRESTSGEWGVPENLGPQINTMGDEVFPYVHSDGTFYFSSDGHVGMGGLDIFKATYDEENGWKVINMKYPVNSPGDDFGIVFQDEVEAGFLSSSRGVRSDDDIYSFFLPPLKFNIDGVVLDEKTEEPLAEAVVKSIGSDGITLEATTDKKGGFKFMLKPATDYVFIASKKGYLNNKERETTKGLDESKNFSTKIYLASIAKPIDLPNIFYDFAKWDLRPESMVELDKLVETLNDNPHVTIELMSHTDSRGSAEANIELSQKRAQSVVDYLIEKGIEEDRLSAKGYGESTPKIVDEKINEEYPFFPNGTVLDEEFINSLETPEQQEVAHQINRRTEFKVLRTDFKQ